MSDPYVSALSGTAGRSTQLDQVLGALLRQAPDVEAAAVVSFDGLPMASALPAGMDEDRVAAMSAALLSLGERAAQGLGRGDLSQVYVEGDAGTVFLVSADDEAVLVAVARAGAKVGMMLFEVKQAAEAVATALRVQADPLPPLVGAAAPQVVHQATPEQTVEQTAHRPVQQHLPHQPVQQMVTQPHAADPDPRSNGHASALPQPTPALAPDPLGDPVSESSWDADQARDRRPATVAPDGSAWS
jgi:predicted regulator of Ras-like GTPase activity (Roadblock/LC7/MglB family)